MPKAHKFPHAVDDVKETSYSVFFEISTKLGNIFIIYFQYSGSIKQFRNATTLRPLLIFGFKNSKFTYLAPSV